MMDDIQSRRDQYIAELRENINERTEKIDRLIEYRNQLQSTLEFTLRLNEPTDE